MPHRVFLILSLLFLLHLSSPCQDVVNELDQRNGFKKIKMGMPVDSIPGIKFKKDFSDKEVRGAALYEVDHADYQEIGGVRIQKVEVKAYKGKVYDIRVITDRNPELMRGLESVLGPPQYDVRNEKYVWQGRLLTLTFRSLSRNQLELHYISRLIRDWIEEEKKSRIKGIADDF